MSTALTTKLLAEYGPWAFVAIQVAFIAALGGFIALLLKWAKVEREEKSKQLKLLLDEAEARRATERAELLAVIERIETRREADREDLKITLSEVTRAYEENTRTLNDLRVTIAESRRSNQ